MKVALYGKINEQDKEYYFEKKPCRYFKPVKIFLFSKFYDVTDLNGLSNPGAYWTEFAKKVLGLPEDEIKLDQSICIPMSQVEDDLVNSEKQCYAVFLLEVAEKDENGKCGDLEPDLGKNKNKDTGAEEPWYKTRYCGTLKPVRYEKEKDFSSQWDQTASSPNFIVSTEAFYDEEALFWKELFQELKMWMSDDSELTSFSAVLAAAIELDNIGDKIPVEIVNQIKSISYDNSENSLNSNLDKQDVYNEFYAQCFYRAVYEYAYTYEYYHVYKHFLEDYFLNDYVEGKKEMIGFMPLGCGTKPDGVALIRAAKELGIPREKLLYRGVDMAEWNRYGLDYYINDKKDFVQRKADEYFEEIKMLMRDVYVFPKSISELAPKGVYENSPLEKIACSIRDKLHKEKETKFYILVTIRRYSDDQHRVKIEDLNSIQNLINTITENGRFTFCKQEQKEGKDIIGIPGNSNLKDTIYFYEVGKPQEGNKNIMEDTTYSKYSQYLRNKVNTTLRNYETKPIIDGDQIREGEDLNKSMMVKYANLGYCILAFEEQRKPDKK